MPGGAAPRACVLLAEGFEEIEALTPVDWLRRAGIEVVILGVGGIARRGARGVEVVADRLLDASSAAERWDCVVVPGGGPGSRNLAASAEVTALLRRLHGEGRLVASICAAPALVLHGSCGILAGRRFTCFPGMEAEVSGATFVAERVVRDGSIITSRAAGCAAEFSIAIIEALVGAEEARKVAEAVLQER